MTQRTRYPTRDDHQGPFGTNADLLLAVLDQLEVPLHTDDMDLAARRRVRNRDVSFAIRQRGDRESSCQTPNYRATATRLGVSLLT